MYYIIQNKKYKNLDELVNDYNNVKCEKCGETIDKEAMKRYAKAHNKIDNILCGNCRRSIATANKNRNMHLLPYKGYKLISPNNKTFKKDNVNLKQFEEYIVEKHYNDCKCPVCNDNYVPFGNWYKAFPNHAKLYVDDDNYKVIDLTNWRCKSCTSRNSMHIANEKYRKGSKAYKKKRNNNIAKTIKDKANNDIEYRKKLLLGLINSLNDKKDFKAQFKKCKTMEDIRDLDSKVHSQLNKELLENDEYRERRLRIVQSDEFKDKIRASFKKSDYQRKKLVQWAIKLTNFSEQEMLDILQHKTITDNQITAWINLLKEWYFGNVNRDCDTVLYWAKSHSKRGKYKIGITNNIISRSSKIYFGAKNDCYDYHIIRTLDNRYKCAFIEYMVRVKFCDSGNEYIDKDKLNDVIKYINNFKFTTYYKNKMIELGYKN